MRERILQSETRIEVAHAGDEPSATRADEPGSARAEQATDTLDVDSSAGPGGALGRRMAWRRASARGELIERIAPVVLGLAGVATVVLVWQVLVSVELVSPLSVPEPATVAARIGDLVVDAEFRSQVGDTMITWAAAMIVTTLVAVPAGVLFGYFPFLYRSSSSLVDAGRSIPSTALIPISILFFGLGFQMKLVIVSYAVFWPILVNTSYGVSHVDRVMLQVGRTFRWSTFTILRRVVLPSATPYAATGIRLAGGIGLVVVLSAELLGATRGIGTVVIDYQQAERPDFVYACIVIIGIIGIAVYYGMRAIESRLFPWAGVNRGNR